jgi:hypothetical protein
MKKLILPLLTLIFFAVSSPINIYAASLFVSRSSNFATDDLNFNGGEKVYIRVESDGSGSSQKILNIRDNEYNLVSSVGLLKAGNIFSASFNAPNSQGYFSLEVVVEGDGESSKSVKTIKVGNPGSANVRVNVNSSVKGTKISSSTKSDNQNGNEQSKDSKDDVDSASPTPVVYSSQDNSAYKAKPVKSNWFFTIINNVFSFLWPFK